MKQLPHIGTIELVSLLEDDVKAIPAKTDTGAYSSSIWATDIKEKDGTLSFKLFSKQSIFYTGKIHKTKEYKVTRVRNSFGDTEKRYKVDFTCKIAGKSFKTKFTLANRESNRYPILIGRQALSGQFLVDVSIKTKHHVNVLMLSKTRAKSIDKMLANIHQHNPRVSTKFASLNELTFNLATNNSHITLQGGEKIDSFDSVYFKTTTNYKDIAAAVANYLETRRIPYIDKAIRNFPSSSKLYQYSILADHNISVPKSIFMSEAILKDSFDYITKELGLPFVLKDIHAEKGEDNFLVNSEKEFNKLLKKLKEKNLNCIAQQYIGSDHDYRVLVFGNKVTMIIKRLGNSESHLNNTSKGAKASLEDISAFPKSILLDCIKSAKLLQRQIAGVDLIKDKVTNIWYCLEVNDGPQLATGSFTSEKQAALADYLEQLSQ